MSFYQKLKDTTHRLIDFALFFISSFIVLGYLLCFLNIIKNVVTEIRLALTWAEIMSVSSLHGF